MLTEQIEILRNFAAIRREQWLDHDSIERLQGKKLEKILQCAYRTEHYSRIMDELSLAPADLAEDLTALPLTRKESIRLSPDSFLQKGMSKESLARTTTSGSTGSAVEIFTDTETNARQIASHYYDETRYGRSPFELYVHIGVMERFFHPNPLLARIGLFPSMFLCALDDESKNLAELQKHKPKMVRGYTSTVLALARLNEEQERPLRLKSILLAGEKLTDQTRKIIEHSFSCRVFERYGTMEFPSLALECPEEGNLHVSASSYILEILDEKGRPKKNGTGEIVVTHLTNKAMPMLRYCIGDRGSWGKCSCGRSLPVLESLDGRTNDLIILPSGRILPAVTLIIIPLEAKIRGILKYQVIQEREDLMLVRYVPIGKDITDQTKKEIGDMIRMVCRDELEVEFERVEHIERNKGGKIRNFVSKLKAPKL